MTLNYTNTNLHRISIKNAVKWIIISYEAMGL